VPPRIYSEQFVRTAHDSGLYLWTCPVGQRAVIRSVTTSNPSEGTSIVQVFVAGSCIVHFRFQATTYSQAFDLRTVVYAGELLQVYVGTDGPHVGVGGYLFDDTGDEPAAVDSMRELHGREVEPLPM
jgi:hypothetical protein